MNTKITYNGLFPLQKALHRLYDSGMKFRFEKAVRLVEVMRDVDGQVDEVMDQLAEAIPGLKEIGYQMTDSEQEVYAAILNTQTVVDDRGIGFRDFPMSMSDAALIDMETVNILLSFFVL